MFAFYGEVGKKELEARDEKRKNLEFRGVKHSNYIEFAKTLINQPWSSSFFDNSVREVFAYKGAKQGLLKALRKNADQFPALRGDITGSTLYYILSCRKDGFGRKDDTRSLCELRTIQRANNPDRFTSLTDCYNQTIGSQDEWDQYEFILRYEKLADADAQAPYKEQYHDAIIAFMKKTSSGTQKLRLFFKLDCEVDLANYEKGCALIKERFQPRHFNEARFAAWIDFLKKKKKPDECIRLVAAADRRELLNLHILNDESLVAFLRGHYDAYSRLFSASKLRPLISSLKPLAEGEEPVAVRVDDVPAKKPWVFPWTPSAQKREDRELQNVIHPANKK